MKTNSVDLAAKLLATEDITVIRAAVRTASFDIKSRVLTLPQWKEMTPELEQMLMGHEVGHAKYTTEEYVDTIKENTKIMGYLNVIEDVRVEKLMKREYPGIRKVMAEGYRQLNAKDFFGISKIPDLSTLNLIDRINLYFKAGFQCGVKFTSTEKVFVDAVERTETVDEVIALSKEIYEFSKKEIEKKIGERKKQAILDQENLGPQDNYNDYDSLDDGAPYVNDADDADDADEDGLEQDNDPGLGQDLRTPEERDAQRKKEEEKSIEEELEAKTEKTFNEKLEALADVNTSYIYYNLDENYKFDPVIGFKRILSETTSIEEAIGDDDKKNLETFKNDSSRVVNYLIKEFEMRKSATLYKRAQTSKTGSLDMKKIWSYKINEDLFKRVISIPEGKNHGMVFLLDWSGSMDFVLQDTMKQVISLAMFCHRAQIPYQVFAFTTQYRLGELDSSKFIDLHREFYSEENNKTFKMANAITSFGLLELFSHKMSNVEFNTMMRRFINPRKALYVEGGHYSTGGTPLNEALAYLVSYLPKFAKSNNVEKLSLITLTDGEGHMLDSNGPSRFRSVSYLETSGKRGNLRHFLQDKQTKNSYEIFDNGHSQSDAIIRLMKDRYGVNIIGFYICENRRASLADAIKHNVSGFTGGVENMVDLMRQSFRQDGFMSIKNTGRDDLFIIPMNKLKMEDGELEVEEKQSARQIARSFTKHLTGRKTSRVLLNKFIGYVA